MIAYMQDNFFYKVKEYVYPYGVTLSGCTYCGWWTHSQSYKLIRK